MKTTIIGLCKGCNWKMIRQAAAQRQYYESGKIYSVNYNHSNNITVEAVPKPYALAHSKLVLEQAQLSRKAPVQTPANEKYASDGDQPENALSIEVCGANPAIVTWFGQ